MENEMRKHINQVKYFGKKIVNEGYKAVLLLLLLLWYKCHSIQVFR
jgi:hypothetical protein